MLKHDDEDTEEWIQADEELHVRSGDINVQQYHSAVFNRTVLKHNWDRLKPPEADLKGSDDEEELAGQTQIPYMMLGY